MQLPDEPSLMQTVLVTAPLGDDLESAWAFALFCGLFESSARQDFMRVAAEKAGDALAMADALLDVATARAELVDRNQELADRLWQYYQVGRSLEPEPDEGTQPGLFLPEGG